MKKTTATPRRRIDDEQLDLFALLAPTEAVAPGSLHIGLTLRQALSLAIKESGLERIDLCAHLYKLTGVEVSKTTLDSWSAEGRDKTSEALDFNGNKRWGVPAEMIPALCFALGSFSLLHHISDACRHRALTGKDVVRARLGLIEEQQNCLAAERERLRAALLHGAP